MKNNLLLEEEIEKIKRLSGLNEAAGGPNQAIAKLIATIQSTPLSDDVIREFEVLANGGKISINKSSKKITSIIWKDLSDDEVKLLFKSQEISDIFKKILNDNNIATDPTAIALYSPNLKKIIKGYEDAKNLPKIGGGTSTGGNVGSSVANIAIDIEGYLTKYFPNITSDKNIYSSLVNEIKPKLSNLDTKGQIDFITNKCTSLEKQIGDNLQNLTDMDGKESVVAMKKASSILKVIKEKLKKYGPLSYSKTGTVKFWASIPRTLGWVAAMDILVGGAVESRKTGENLSDTMFKRAGDRGAYVLGLFVSGMDKMIGSTPKKDTEPEKEKIEY